MSGVYALNKSMGGLYYLHGSDDRTGYSLELLAENYPGAKFVLLNDSDTMGLSNVYTKEKIMKACNMDNKLQITCPACRTKNQYIRSQCRNCDTEIPYHDMLLSVFGSDYVDSLSTVQIDEFFGEKSPQTFSKSFEPYYTNDMSDPFINLLRLAFFSESE